MGFEPGHGSEPSGFADDGLERAASDSDDLGKLVEVPVSIVKRRVVL